MISAILPLLIGSDDADSDAKSSSAGTIAVVLAIAVPIGVVGLCSLFYCVYRVYRRRGTNDSMAADGLRCEIIELGGADLINPCMSVAQLTTIKQTLPLQTA